ncbi:MAG: adenylosuccinate synthetase, partial [Chloroflexota bacterium]
MPLNIVVGAQWGDEGKGRIVDYLAAGADYVARYNGGDNAGHTVTVGSQIFKLHLIPSGIVHPHVTAVLGNGMVINPRTLLDEMTALRHAGVSISPQRLRISPSAHLITPAHQALDKA